VSLDGASAVILGAGSHAQMLSRFLGRIGYDIRGYIANAEPDEGLTWLGRDVDLKGLLTSQDLVFNGIGSIRDTTSRKSAFLDAQSVGARFGSFVHTTSIVDVEANIQEAAQILAGAIIQPSSTIGANVLINTGAIIEHDVVVGDHCHIAPGVCLCGGVNIQSGAHIGAGALVLQNVCIGKDVVIGAGAVIRRDVPDHAVMVGNPARQIPRPTTSSA
jgi:sugar O-acyltransferase (sialic acid O-acetyltransferase NeuD family)